MCCGNKIARDYGPAGSSEQTGWVVTYPDGKSESKNTEIAARMAAALVPGATYKRAGSSE